MRTRLAAVLAVGGLALAASLSRADNKRLAPIPRDEATSMHSPYEMGACDACHQRNDPRNPGAVVNVSNDLCYGCHDEFRGSVPVRMEKKMVHTTSQAACMACHNPHNSKKKKLRI